MARTLRGVRAIGGALPMGLFWGLPLLLSVAMMGPAAADGAAWTRLLAHPQLVPALGLSLFTGLASTGLALAGSVLLLMGLHGGRAWRLLGGASAAGLALPHLAFAIGFGFLIMPSGLFARLIVGGDAPPAWVSVQDPMGLALTAALALKEIPFLVTAAMGALSRGDAARRLPLSLRAAASLGHGRGSAWLRIVLPPLLRDLRWPLLIVFVYGATVVDMALVLGPTQPPTFAVVLWHALNDADPLANRMGLAGTLLLTAVLVLTVALLAAFLGLTRRWRRAALTRGPSLLAAPRLSARLAGAAGLALLTLCLLLLLMISLAPRWPYPAVLPPRFGMMAWQSLVDAPLPFWLSIGLGLAAAVVAVALAVLWFETQAPGRDGWPLGLALISLALPQLALAGGQYRLFLDWGLTGTLAGLFLAHLAPAVAYVLIVLAGPYRAFDGRYVQAARSLSVSPVAAWARVKLPLLKAPLLTAGAIGFSVSMMQFVPAQLIAAGRFSTLPMEAVTLSSGGNRALTAAFALALALPPLFAFLAASLVGRPRWH